MNIAEGQPEAADPLILPRRSGPAGSKPAKNSKQPLHGKKYYVVWDAPASELELIGVHHCRWAQLRERLPGEALFGSGCQDCKAFADWSAAASYYRDRRRNSSETVPCISYP